MLPVILKQEWACLGQLSTVMSSFSETTQTVLAVAFLAEWLSQSSSTCSAEWNVSMLELLKEEPVLIAPQSEIWNCENLEGWDRHLFILCASYSL